MKTTTFFYKIKNLLESEKALLLCYFIILYIYIYIYNNIVIRYIHSNKGGNKKVTNQ